ncbi:MAG TPA: transcriptional regulator NrdR [Aggregatilineales bacterium]|nr:transcriptional repressor NrdR [Anaerolineales bacterium]HRE46519.1 transcriptional regulator NrdR [Aggregatilineales bacterium]
MQCPYCDSSDLKVLDTTDIKNGIRRRRECQNCHERFTTYERPLAVTPVLIKTNGDREEFDRDKLKRGIWNACAKRPIPAAALDRLVDEIEMNLQAVGRAEVSSRVVGDMVIAGLKDIDPIAYIRYAIVYMGLDNLLSVRAEIDKLLAEQQGYAEVAAERWSEQKGRTDGGDRVAERDLSVKTSAFPAKGKTQGKRTNASGRPRGRKT